MKNFVYFETYGCSANQNNSEIMKGLLKQAGYEITNNEKIADVFVINSCVVKEKTEQKIKRRIQDLVKEYREKLFVVSGCMPQTDFLYLKKINPSLLLLGVHHVRDIVKFLKDFKENKLTKEKEKEYLSVRKEEKVFLPKVSENKLVSIVQISEGCVGECSFCKVKMVKGKLFSYDETKILESVKNDLSCGAKEIWITSQDNACYGLDRGNQELPELLRKILSLNKKFKLRLGMMNPNHVLPIIGDLVEIYKNPKVYKFLHIPIQSASNEVLVHMKRKYRIEEIEEIIKRFRKEIPDITLSTDIIVGYLTEREGDHEKNLEFVRKFRPDVLNLSKFSAHKNTVAGKLTQIEKEIINRRTSEIMQLHRESARENKEKFRGKEIKVFVNKKIGYEEGRFLFEARDDSYNIVLISSREKAVFGKSLKVKIKEIGVHHMFGEITSGQ